LKAEAVGLGEIAMSITGPDGFRIDRQLKIGVRAPQLPIVERTAHRLAPGESLTLGSAALERFVPGSGELYASFSPIPNLDVPGLLRTLDRYPYGCLEQTTSRALPLLYVSDVAQLWRVKDENAGDFVKTRVQDAVYSVIERQRFDGGFGLWTSDSPAENWLSSYAMDFLLRAKQQGYTVPDFAIAQGLKWLDDYSRNYKQDDSEAVGARAYAYYVLATAKSGDISGLRYLHDNYLRRMPSGLAAAQLGAALALHGDQQRAAEAFKVALTRVERERRWMRDYGSSLRDLAAIITLMIESKMTSEDPAPLLDRLARAQFDQTYLSTQEQAWLIMAAYAVAAEKKGNMTLAVDGATQPPRQTALDIRPMPEDLAKGVKVSNAGTDPVWTAATVIGSPLQQQPAEAQGFSIERHYFDLAGNEVTPDTVRQSDMFVVVISGKSQSDVNNQALIIDLLPAGFEVENARLADTHTTNELSWLPELTPTLYSEFLDDRFVAAIDLGWDRRNFTVAYLVRAVTPGTYELPAVQIEDMYQPQYRARSASATVTVTPFQ
jgi:alpha-2-macroglobulin